MQSAQRLADARAISFQHCAEQLIASREVGWRNAKHRQQWRNTLATYAYPILGKVPVADVDTGLVLKVLQQQIAQADDKNVADVYGKKGAKVLDLDDAVVDKWRAIARTTAWKDYGDKSELAAELIKLAETIPVS